MSSITRIAVVVAVVTTAVTAFAHGGHDHGGGNHLMGTVKSVTDNELVVTTSDGHDVTVAIIADTKVERAGAPAKSSDIKAGDRAVVQTMGSADAGGMHAMLIKLGKTGGSADAGVEQHEAQPADGGTKAKAHHDHKTH